ncbi:MAG: ATP-dependent metallopeptidase FtsH/Yme1/Tma family protein [Deltaproteobacteria bacterium]|nr:ATP-dependent metallopeptidase FtsH/Yme1/Tma family protein [Deltaproteobacteria bacterium]
MSRRPLVQLAIFAGLILILLLVQKLSVSGHTEAIPYSRFEEILSAKKVKKVFVDRDEIRGEYAEGSEEKKYFVTQRVDLELADKLANAGVEYSQLPESGMSPLLLYGVLPLVPLLLVFWFMNRRVGAGGAGGLMTIGKSKAKVYVETDTKVTFADVAGVDEAKHELEEIVAFLKDPKSHGRLGARMPKGVLLVGPPGTGKTLLARAVAGEANVPFFSISGSEFVEMFVGVGAARVRDLFEQARAKAPAIIFIDELDALGRARNAGPFSGGHDEKEQTLNQLLVELDGFDVTSGLVLLSATNRPEILDPALLRAGRFDRQVLVDRPDRTGREQILRVHIKGVTLADDVRLDQIAQLTPGFTGADLANLVNEAALLATRRGGTSVTTDDFTAGVERIVAGLEKKNRLMNAREREIVAFHEMGHALVAQAIPGCDPVHKISIIPRGIGALGYTIQRPTDERFLMTMTELENKMSVLLGGRVAEKIVFDHLSTGAADDLEKVTNIARTMVTRYGMVEELGHVTYEGEPRSFLGREPIRERTYSEDTAERIDRAVRGLVDSAFHRAESVLRGNRGLLEEGARTLLERETLDEAALSPLFARIERSKS